MKYLKKFENNSNNREEIFIEILKGNINIIKNNIENIVLKYYEGIDFYFEGIFHEDDGIENYHSFYKFEDRYEYSLLDKISEGDWDKNISKLNLLITFDFETSVDDNYEMADIFDIETYGTNDIDQWFEIRQSRDQKLKNLIDNLKKSYTISYVNMDSNRIGVIYSLEKIQSKVNKLMIQANK